MEGIEAVLSSDMALRNGSQGDFGQGQESPVDPVLYRIQLYFTPALVTLGTLGNCFSIMVFFASRKLSKLSSR